ncbi:hypothetical protein H2248_005206 [Termitomyces sp. 'cryptogamus']|nr:hypothetical protein H2248_005206 [Termitomyces sp. 'cryptogamus']
MHSFISRVNNVSAFLSSVTMCLLASIALSSFLFTTDPKGEVYLTSIKVFPTSQRRTTKKQEMTFVNFNISADLTPLFHWNTKQLFLYLEAEYTNAKGVSSVPIPQDSFYLSPVLTVGTAIWSYRFQQTFAASNSGLTFRLLGPK